MGNKKVNQKPTAENSAVGKKTLENPTTKRRKWNRDHSFARKESTPRQVGHPVYIYGKSGRLRKYLTFTHKPEEGKELSYEQLKHNIDPEFDGKEPTYVKKQYSISHKDMLRAPDKKYRIHHEDKETIKKLKK